MIKEMFNVIKKKLGISNYWWGFLGFCTVACVFMLIGIIFKFILWFVTHKGV